MTTRVLFLCTGNSARSQMAEAFLRKYAGDRFEAHSAGLEPKGVNPFTIQVMHRQLRPQPDGRSFPAQIRRRSFRSSQCRFRAQRRQPVYHPGNAGSRDRYFWPNFQRCGYLSRKSSVPIPDHCLRRRRQELPNGLAGSQPAHALVFRRPCRLRRHR